MAQVPSFTPDQVTDLQAPHIPYQNDEAARIVEAGRIAVARQVGEVGEGSERMAIASLKVKAEFDRNEVESRLNDLASKRSEIDSRIITLKGRAALGSAEQALNTYDEASRALDTTFANPQQQALFRRHVAEQRSMYERGWRMNEVQQLELQGEQDFAAGQDRRVSDAGLLHKSKTADGRWAYESILEDGLRSLADRAMAKDWSDERLLLEQRNLRARILTSFILNSIANPADYGSEKAKEALLKYSSPKTAVNEKGEIVLGTGAMMDADVVHKLWSAIHASGTRDEVRVETSRILGATKPDPLTGLRSLSEQEKLARDTIRNPEVLEHVVNQLRQVSSAEEHDLMRKDKALAASMTVDLDTAFENGQPIMVNEADSRWINMGVQGREVIKEHARQLGVARRAEASALRGERARMVTDAMNSLRILPPSERAKVDVDSDIAFTHLTGPEKNAVKAQVIEPARQQVARDFAITGDRVHAMIKTAADEMSYSDGRKKEFIAHVDARLAHDFPDKNKPAGEPDVAAAIADELLWGTRERSWNPATWAGGMARWQAEQKGVAETWKPSPAEEQRYKRNRNMPPLAPPAAPAAPPPPGQPPAPANAPRFKPMPKQVEAEIGAALVRAKRPNTPAMRWSVWIRKPEARETQ